MKAAGTRIADWNALQDRKPAHARVGNVDLVVMRLGDDVSVLYGRCTHRNALLAEGHLSGDTLVCAKHGWDFHCRTGQSTVDQEEALQRFEAWVADGAVLVDAEAIRRWRAETPLDFLENELDN